MQKPNAQRLQAVPIDEPSIEELERRAKGLRDTITAPQRLLAFSDVFNRVFGAAEMAENAYPGAPKFWGILDRVVRRGAGVLGVVGGGFQAGLGAVQLAKGERAEGAVNASVGSLYVLAGASEFSRRFAAAVGSWFQRIGARLGGGTVPVAAPLFGLANVIGGAYQYFVGRKSGDARAAGIGGLKVGGGALLVASAFLGGAIGAIPLAVAASVAGSVICLGAVFWENGRGISRFWRKVGGWLRP